MLRWIHNVSSNVGSSIFLPKDRLQARLVLEKQDEIREIERELQDMDFEDREEVPQSKLVSRIRRNPKEGKQRRKFFARAERVYKEYALLLSATNQMLVRWSAFYLPCTMIVVRLRRSRTHATQYSELCASN